MEPRKLDEAAAYAIGALPAEEAADFEQLSDTVLERELDSFREVAVALIDGLPDIVPAASPELWNHISEQSGISSAPGAEEPHRAPWFPKAAAAFLAVLAVGAMTFLAGRGTVDAIRSEAAAAIVKGNSMVVTLTSPDGIAAIRPEVIIAADGTGYVIADSLPRLTADHTYQLWLIIDDRVVSAALLGNEPEVVEFRAEGTIRGIAISNEITGGVAVSEVSPTALWVSDSV